MITTIISFLISHWAVAGGTLSVLTAAIPFAGNLLSGGTVTYVKWGLMAVALLAVAGLSFYLTRNYYLNEIKGVEAQYVAAAAAANAKALAVIQQHDAAANKAVAQAQADATAQEQQIATIRKTIYATPKSYACVRSPAIQSVLNWMRGSTAGR